MRRFRPLLLVAILGILAAIAASYYARKSVQEREAPPLPRSLPEDLTAAADDWRWSHTVEGRPVVEVRASNFRQVRQPSRFDLEGVELRLFSRDGNTFDRVRSAQAEFDIEQGLLYSDGDVQIVMGVPDAESPEGLVSIRTSGATFETRTGRASTDRFTAFSFEQGEGTAVGAAYDPTTRELTLRSEVKVTLEGRGPGAGPMTVEAGELRYIERDAVILLRPWSRFTRGGLRMVGGEAILRLEEGLLRRVEAREARGAESQPGRSVEYEAELLAIDLAPSGETEKIAAEGKVRLAHVLETSRTTVTTHRADLFFEPTSGGSELRKAVAVGNSVVESRPVKSGKPGPPARVLRSDVIELAVRPGGREIEFVTTHTPGIIEFLPVESGDRRRRLDGERIRIDYGAESRVRSFQASAVSTRTEPPRTDSENAPPALLTWSGHLRAEFDEATGELARMEQWDNFRFEEGDRKGSADHAVLDAGRDLITLAGAARLADSSGSTSASRILLDQKRGEFQAEGNVASTRAPATKEETTAMLSAEEPVHAKADRMVSNDRKRVIHYEGNAVLWQGGNRIQAGWIEIDRESRRLAAKGNVVTQFVQQPEDAKQRSPGGAVFTIIEAPELQYVDQERAALYSGGVRLLRPSTEVRAARLRALLGRREGGPQLERAHAEGSVEIIHTADHGRRATAEHAEYYAGEERIVLYGGRPKLADERRGTTQGERLTWYINDDRLLVESGEQQPSVSRILLQ